MLKKIASLLFCYCSGICDQLGLEFNLCMFVIGVNTFALRMH